MFYISVYEQTSKQWQFLEIKLVDIHIHLNDIRAAGKFLYYFSIGTGLWLKISLSIERKARHSDDYKYVTELIHKDYKNPIGIVFHD